ncbi:hypothetical protein [Ruegeria atlantica]|uniref:hypothetical protein n=1 Tax=Ruegeria atlantica TaxID=81569 RepID=UPI00147B4007|nr:hypothetical protein [Ruegeria atlantica]
MDFNLSKRHYAALDTLQFECDYEDGHNGGELIYVQRIKLSPRIGDKTLADLEGLGLIERGINKWFGSLGYRITDLGREALENRPRSKPKAKPKHKLRPLDSRIGTERNRLDR